MTEREVAVVTGASTGIGYQLAKCCAEDGYEVVICADEPKIEQAAERLREGGRRIEAVEADLGTTEGIERLWQAVRGRPVGALLANAGIGHQPGFLDGDFAEAKKVIDVNVTGSLALIHRIGRQMRERGKGRILITSSVVGEIPGSYMAPYAASKAFLENFSYALRDELKDTGVTVTCLMPGATETDFFDRAGMEDTPVGKQENKADPAKVARDGYEAMKKGQSGITSGFMNKVQTLFADILPEPLLAQMSRRMAKPVQEKDR